VYFAASLRAVGVDAKVVGNVVRLDSDSFFGLLVATNALPPGLTPLYRSKDLHVYAGVEKGRVRYYFAARHKGVWRAAEGLHKKRSVELKRAEREVLEAIRSVVARALETLSRPAEVGEPKEVRGGEGNVKAHYLPLYGYHVVPFLEHAAEGVETELAEVRLEGRRIAVKAGGAEAAVEFKLLKRNETVFLLTQDVAQTLALYRSLKALGAPVEITPKGVGINSEVLWTLVASAVERSALGGLPAEIMPGVKLLRVYNAGGMHIYIFRVSEEGAHYYFVVKTRQGWRAADGKQSGRQVQINGEAAHAVADAINAVYREMGVDRKIEVRYGKDGVSRIKLTNVDLELLGVK